MRFGISFLAVFCLNSVLFAECFAALPGTKFDRAHSLSLEFSGKLLSPNNTKARFGEGDEPSTLTPACTLYNNSAIDLKKGTSFSALWNSRITIGIADNGAVDVEYTSGGKYVAYRYELVADLFEAGNVESGLHLLCYSANPFSQENLSAIFGDEAKVEFK